MLTAGQAATRAGVTRKAMRLYEAKGLLDEPVRTAVGYRLYTTGDIDVLVFIRQARTLGLHLDDIATILDIRRHGVAPCPTVHTLIGTRITEIDTAIADLRALRRSLVHTRDTPSSERPAADSEPAAVCPIVEHTRHAR
ncbi:MerR family DNA-binding protein [Nocardia salmonicida]|uniref:MerR family DNA-binding protein n=1 Tax=Nocardia salmonicida TaxID=53431 RepID=UPI0020D26823|nr:MerR family DNA-binding protein [Nocardia salmonicida]